MPQVEQEWGGVYDIGDYITFSHHWEQDPPGFKVGCGRLTCSACVSKKDEKMAELWANTTGEEIEVESQTPDGTSQKKKLINGSMVYRIEGVNKKWTSTLELIKKWRCNTCPYGSEALPHHCREVKQQSTAVPRSLLQAPSSCALDVLSDDAFEALAGHLPSESIISLSSAYPRFREIVTSFHILLRRELRCFFLRVPLNECILGVGIAMDARARTFSSDFDWLSMEAFDRYAVRTSIEKRSFDYFLPLAFNRPHFLRALPDIKKRLFIIDSGLRQAEAAINRRTGRTSNRRTGPPQNPYDTVEVLYSMMNAIVVSLMKSCDDMREPTDRYSKPATLLFASEKAVTSYCLLLHLLMCLCRSTPAILHGATSKLRRFIDDPKSRWKQHTPNLGELIIQITLVLVMPPVDKTRPITWEMIRGKFLEEAVTRNVRWVLDESPELQVMEVGASDYRLETTFKNSRTSLRLIMFQVTFLNVFRETYAEDIGRLDDNYGFADKELPERMVKEVKQIYRVTTWPQFFVKVVLGKELGKEGFSDMLRETVRESARRGYHRPARPEKMGKLVRMRKEGDLKRVEVKK